MKNKEEEFILHKKAIKNAKENYPEAFEDNPKEFNLSEKIYTLNEINEWVDIDEEAREIKNLFVKEDVKEFIKRQIDRIEARLCFLRDVGKYAEIEVTELRKIREDLKKDAGEELGK